MRSFREADPIRLGMIALGVAVTLLALAFSLNAIPFVARGYDIKAEFADAAGISAGNEVRVAGLRVGSVRSVELASDRVIVEMRIDRGVEIPRAAIAEIALRTILGTKFVVIDARAEGPVLEPGETIPLVQTKIPFEIYQAANAAVNLLDDIDASQLNQSFRALAAVAEDPNRHLAGTVHGAAGIAESLGGEADALASLIRNGDLLISALDESSGDIQSLIENSNRLLEVLANRRQSVSSLLKNTDRLAGSLGGLIRDNRTHIDSILRDLHAALLIVDANLGEIEEAVRLLGPTSESFARAFWRARWGNICVFALDDLGTGPAGGPNGPVDCDSSAGGSSTAGVASIARGRVM